MFDTQLIVINEDCIQFKLLAKNEIMSFAEVIEAWQSNGGFNSFYSRVISSCPFEAFFYEHPPLLYSEINIEYEFVLIRSKQLVQARVEEYVFQKYFDSRSDIVHFMNLRNDGALIVPTPDERVAQYAHLASFLRYAPEFKKQNLWTAVGKLYKKWIRKQRTYLSTSGLGVYYLHVRLDTEPRYYQYKPYKLL